jgi:hypothetical protein
MKLERKSDHIKILESDSATLSRNSGYQCINCKERHYMVAKKGDNSNLFCTNCGHLTPLRTIKHGRGLAAPFIQQPTAIIQSESKIRGRDRKPRGVNSDKKDPLVESLISKGFQIIDSQTIEPTP